MTIEEIEAEWERLWGNQNMQPAYEPSGKLEVFYFAEKYMDKLLEVAKSAKRAWSKCICDGPEEIGCRACDLKQAVEELES